MSNLYLPDKETRVIKTQTHTHSFGNHQFKIILILELKTNCETADIAFDPDAVPIKCNVEHILSMRFRKRVKPFDSYQLPTTVIATN
jgi:hypothetical protein